jgi:bleomycin hydrolase
MKSSILKNDIKSFQTNFSNNDKSRVARNALTITNLNDIATDWDAYSNVNYNFSNVVKGELSKVTNQKSSGRCWGFAGLNLMRISVCKQYKLKNFEFSQNYFMFFDKLEKSNYFLENILSTLDESYESRLTSWLLSEPVNDGGQWDMFTNLIEKYGAVPQSVMPESFQSSNSRFMNVLLTRKLREYASVLRSNYQSGTKVPELRKSKTEMMSTIYSMLCMFLGNPPEKFDWSFTDKKKKFHRFNDVTPQTFMKKHANIKLKDKVCLIHCPMSNKKMNELYTVKYLGNVVGGDIINYANVEINELKKAAIKSIKKNEAVWFGCDVGKWLNYTKGVMDLDIFDYENLLDISFNMDKATRLEYGESVMTHAMLFTGVDLVKDKPQKWRVENSWGDKGGDKGYYLMTDKWFDQYNYEVVIDKKYLSKEVLSIFSRKPKELEPWDPMGSLAK